MFETYNFKNRPFKCEQSDIKIGQINFKPSSMGSSIWVDSFTVYAKYRMRFDTLAIHKTPSHSTTIYTYIHITIFSLSKKIETVSICKWKLIHFYDIHT